MLELREPIIRNLSLQVDVVARDALPTTTSRGIDTDRLLGVYEVARVERLSMAQVWSMLFGQEG